MKNSPVKSIRIPLDLSNEVQDVFIEIPPLATNENGEIINLSTKPILKKIGVINIQDKIQSYRKECDLYSILDKVARTGDLSFLDQKAGFYGDVSGTPTDPHSQASLVSQQDSLIKKLNEMSDDEKRALANFFGIPADNNKDIEKSEEVK